MSPHKTVSLAILSRSAFADNTCGLLSYSFAPFLANSGEEPPFVFNDKVARSFQYALASLLGGSTFGCGILSLPKPHLMFWELTTASLLWQSSYAPPKYNWAVPPSSSMVRSSG